MNKLWVIARLSLIFAASWLVVPVNLSASSRLALAAVPSASNTFTVNSTSDTPAADPATGVCADASGKCTLRAAIMVANFVQGTNTILLPAGVYLLTRPGYDDGTLVGDLDIGVNLTIQGAGPGLTIVDGNGAVTGDRVFQILNTALNVTLSGMTIRNGQSLAGIAGAIGGGGIYMQGAGNLTLSNVIIEGNTAQNGGGLYANLPAQGGVITLDHVIVRNNTVTAGGVGAGGGVFLSLLSGLSSVDVHDSQVFGNTADGTGGGFFVSGTDLAHWSIERSQIYSNSAASGAGIGNFLPLTMTESWVSNNHANVDGGGIEAFSPLAISLSTLAGNSAIRYGGGIFSLPTGSSALYNDFLNIVQSTLSGNSAHEGGGIYHDGYINFNSLLTLTNSTLSGNVAYHPSGVTDDADGGGLYLYSGQAQLFNTTVAANVISITLFPATSGTGGGLYVNNTSAISVLTVENSIVAKNVRGNGITPYVPDDCNSTGGTTGALAFDLFTTTTNCFVTGGQVGNIVGQDPLLSPLAMNGGDTQTMNLQPGSPAIDAGATAGCSGAGGIPITVDQRGYPRPIGPACDIGAIEYNPNASEIYLPVIIR